MSVFSIAEIGQAHDGSLGTLHSYIDAVSNIGVNAIKFQTHIATAESSKHERFRTNFSVQDKTRFDYWKRMEFSQSQWIEIGKHCKNVGLQFISSPFSNAAVDILEKADVEIYKVGSGEVSNHLLLKKIIETGKPIIISSGMSNFNELDNTVNFLKRNDAKFSILQCTTNYPTHPRQYGLNVIQELKERYKVKVGFSDHSAQIGTGIAAVALGAEILEFHVVFDRAQFGPDVQSSLTINEAKIMLDNVKNISTAISNPVDKNKNDEFIELKNIFEKSLAVNKSLKRGDIIKFDDLEAKKPRGYGIDAIKYESVIGKELTKDIKSWDFLTYDYLK